MMTGNAFLDSLQAKERAVLIARSELVVVRSGQLLTRADSVLRHAVFPTTSVIALIHRTANGEEAEGGSIGREGMIGSRIILGTQRMRLGIVCCIAGDAYRIPVSDFVELAQASAHVREQAHRYTAARLHEIAQHSACHRFHLPVQRCARWLLTSSDRAGRRTLEITHEFLARLLGMPRSALTGAAGELKRRGAIELGRGAIAIRSRRQLEAASCECYRAIVRVFKTLYAS